MRTGVGFKVSDEQHGRLEAIMADGNSRMKDRCSRFTLREWCIQAECVSLKR